MPQSAWSAKRERQYEHIKESAEKRVAVAAQERELEAARREGERLRQESERLLREREARLSAARASLAHLDPAQVLRRGYALARLPDGRVVRTGATLVPGERLSLTFAEGGAEVTGERATGAADGSS